MSQGTIMRVFPGANTSRGFYSLYNYIIPQDTTRIFIIKGGPGVGKSTFMKKICQSLTDKGFNAEWHCCSSDNGSIDGVVFPEIGVAMIDGTAPHIVDPKNPGAVDEIIHLGDFWQESILRQHKDEVIATNRRVGRLFGIAYYALQEAQAAMNEWVTYTTEAQNWAKVNQQFNDLWKEVTNEFGSNVQWETTAADRHLFAWGITPQGKSNFIDTLLAGISRLYLIEGEPGSGKSEFIGNFGRRLKELGLDVEFYHNTLNPDKLDGVIVRGIGIALFAASEPFAYQPESFVGNVKRISLSASLDQSVLNTYAQEIAGCTSRFTSHMNRAISYVAQAKEKHDQMETYYVKAMDFTAIEKRRQEIEQRILGYAEELAVAAAAQGKSKV